MLNGETTDTLYTARVLFTNNRSNTLEAYVGSLPYSNKPLFTTNEAKIASCVGNDWGSKLSNQSIHEKLKSPQIINVKSKSHKKFKQSINCFE